MNELRVKEMKEEKEMGLFFQDGCESILWPEQVQMIDLCSVIWTYSCLVFLSGKWPMLRMFFKVPIVDDEMRRAAGDVTEGKNTVTCY